MLASKESTAIKDVYPDITYLTKYAWADGKKKVTIYLDLTDKQFEGEDFEDKSKTTVNFEKDETSFKLTLIDSS